jgi:Phosphodiester glycosidase
MYQRLLVRSSFVCTTACVLLSTACAYADTALITTAELPYQVERFNLPGPVAGVAVKVDLADARVKIKVALADDHDPDGDGPCVGQLDTPSSAARKNDFAIALNASFFSAPTAKDILGQKIRYFVGNCTIPVGWHFSGNKLLSKPTNSKLRATLIVDEDGKVSIADNVETLPKNTRYAVSGNAMVLQKGKIIASEKNAVRHPRSAVGLSADRKTLILVAVDGRQATLAFNFGDPIEPGEEKYIGHSRGVTYAELGALMKSLGAADAINLDGGGSTALVVKDFRTGVFSVANQPSDLSTFNFPIRAERPVADVIGVIVDTEKR